jgi:hypothetical protein
MAKPEEKMSSYSFSDLFWESREIKAERLEFILRKEKSSPSNNDCVSILKNYKPKFKCWPENGLSDRILSTFYGTKS